MKTSILSVLLLVLCSCTAVVAQSGAVVDWHALKFLMGEWVGEGTTETGRPGGGFCSFERSLQGKALVRKNHSEYPGVGDQPAIAHDDLMIIYFDPRAQQLRAFYTDSEGNVIHYSVSGDGGKTAVFLGDVKPGEPRYRLTYSLLQPDHMTIKFEMAPAGKPDEFQKFIEGKLRRSAKANGVSQ